MVSVRPKGIKRVRSYEERTKLYEIVRKLALEGKSPREIREELAESLKKKLSLTLIKDWGSAEYSPYGRVYQLRTDHPPELSYLIGVDRGDTSQGKSSWHHNYTIRLRVKDEDFVREFARAAAEVLSTRPFKVWFDKKRGLWQTDVNSMLLFRLLNRPLKDLKEHIEHCLKCTAAFLRGFFDAEAGVGKESLTVSNGIRGLVIYVQNLLIKYFGIESTGPYLRGPPPGTRKIVKGRSVTVNMYSNVLRVRSNSLRSFEESIGFTLQRKKEALHKLIESKFLLK